MTVEKQSSFVSTESEPAEQRGILLQVGGFLTPVEKFFRQAGFSLFLYNYHCGRTSLEGVGSQWI